MLSSVYFWLVLKNIALQAFTGSRTLPQRFASAYLAGMKFYQHRFDDPQSYLHHRPPYLLIESVESIDDDAMVAKSSVDLTNHLLPGHFPGAPILPGALMQEMSTQAAGILIAANYNPMSSFDTTDPFHNEYALGVLVRIKSARYKGFARPGDEISIHVNLVERLDSLFDFKATIRTAQGIIMRNEFQLSNIPSKTLQGKS